MPQLRKLLFRGIFCGCGYPYGGCLSDRHGYEFLEYLSVCLHPLSSLSLGPYTPSIACYPSFSTHQVPQHLTSLQHPLQHHLRQLRLRQLPRHRRFAQSPCTSRHLVQVPTATRAGGGRVGEWEAESSMGHPASLRRLGILGPHPDRGRRGRDDGAGCQSWR